MTDPTALAAIWAEVLGLDAVDQDANFFDLGGDSVAAVRIVAHCGAAGIPLALGDIFTHQTVAAVLAALDEREPAPW